MKNAFKPQKYLIWVCLFVVAVTAAAWQIETKRKPTQQPASTIQQEILPNPNNVIMIKMNLESMN